MAQNFKGMYISIILAGVFIFAMISFVTQVQTQNNANETILDNAIINSSYNKLSTNLSSLQGNTQDQKENFEAEIPERGFGSLIIFAIVGVVQKFSNMMVLLYNTFIVLPATILNIPSVVLGALGAIFMVSLVLLAWRVYRAGE